MVDFGVFKRAVRDLAEELDHTFLVEEGSLAATTLAALEAEGFSLTVLPSAPPPKTWRATSATG